RAPAADRRPLLEDAERQARALLKSAPAGPGRGSLEFLVGRCEELRIPAGGDKALSKRAADSFARAVADDPTLIDAWERRAAILRDGLKDPAGAADVLDKMVAAFDRGPEGSPGRWRAYLIRA